MRHKNPPPPPEGKHTIDQEHHENVGQRDHCHTVGNHGKPTIEQDNHDQNIGQRDFIDEEDEPDVDAEDDTEATRVSIISDDRDVE